MISMREKRIHITLRVLQHCVVIPFSVVMFFLSYGFVHAQVSTVNIVVNPEHPRAYEQFSVGLTSGSVDLERSTISWYLNDKLGLKGVGKVGFMSTTGPVGTEFLIRAVIETPTETTITRTSLVRPQEVDILWRAHAYVPPFYKGRALPPSSGLVIVTAMPNMVDGDGNLLDPQKLVYTWSQRGIVLGNASGYGKQTIVLENGQISKYPLILSLIVTTLDNTVFAEKRIEIPVTDPSIVFYEHKPLVGVDYAHGLADFAITKEETVIRAEPYFFSIDDVVNKRLAYSWTLNNSPVETPERKNEITLRRDEKIGTALLRLHIENDNLPLRILQETKKDLRLNIQ